ncbi:MAG: pyridoxal-5'-phosphate-dependent protein subunit beta [Acidobacteria bacterium]|nr:MAG: pyridoxal-5'-phosphate-dependent protein subunit beta [Acidobacteriota bacterium]
MLPSPAQVCEARRIIAGSAIRTPLVRLNAADPVAEIYLKLENLQPHRIIQDSWRAKRDGRMPRETFARGVLTASAGNMAQGVAWCAREFGIPCTVVAPETKIKAVERPGGRVLKVPFDEWWRTFEQRSYPGVDAAFIHAFDDLEVMAGNGTIGLAILEDQPEVDAVIIPWGSGELTCGIASVLRALLKIYVAEVATAAPLAPSLAAGSPKGITYQPSFVDGIGGKSVFPQMLERARGLIDGSLVAELDEVADAVRLLAERNRVVAEGAGACPAARALKRGAGVGKIVCVVSGGNIDLSTLCAILTNPPSTSR